MPVAAHTPSGRPAPRHPRFAADARALHIAPPDDVREQRADSLATAALGWSPPSPGQPGNDDGTRFAYRSGALAEVLNEPGRPLAAGVRSEMERGFGRDFSRVRIHDGPAAAGAAATVSARAFTTGNHVAFSAGRYRPSTWSGRWLLAHELAHTIEQGDATAPGLWRLPDGGSQAAPTTQPSPRATPACPPPPSAQCASTLAATSAAAVSQLTRAESSLIDYAGSQVIGVEGTQSERAEHRRVATFLQAYFSTTDALDAEAIAYRLARIRNALSGNQVCMTCDEHCGAGTGGSVKEGYTPEPMHFVMCGSAGDPAAKANTMIHECAHAVLPDVGVREVPKGDHRSGVLDRAYRAERSFRLMSTVEAMTNAESYAALVEGLIQGGPVPPQTRYSDEIKKCADPGAIESGLGRAEVAARVLSQWMDALLETMRRDGLATVTAVSDPLVAILQTSFPTISTVAQLQELQNDVAVVFNNISNPEAVTCTKRRRSCPEGRLAFAENHAVTATTMSKMPSMIDRSGAMGLCPAWFSAADEDRTRALYAVIASRYLGGARISRLTPEDAMRLATLATAAMTQTLPPPVAKSAGEHLAH